jgi:hypothetical protein
LIIGNSEITDTTYIGRSHRRQFSIGVIGWCDLDDIGGYDVQAIQTP